MTEVKIKRWKGETIDREGKEMNEGQRKVEREVFGTCRSEEENGEKRKG